MAGSVSSRVSPPSGEVLALMLPQWASTTLLTIDSPSTEPPVLRLRDSSMRHSRSNSFSSTSSGTPGAESDQRRCSLCMPDDSSMRSRPGSVPEPKLECMLLYLNLLDRDQMSVSVG